MEIVKAQKIAYEVVAQLQPFCSKIEVAGSIRRHRPVVHDIDLVYVRKRAVMRVGGCEKCLKPYDWKDLPVPSTPAKDAPKNFSLRQKEFADWQEYNFGKGEVSDMIHGMSEEIGEMSHAYLKSKNKIRGMTPEMAKEKMADAFADTVTFGIQAMTALGLNAEEVLNKTFDEVLARNWKENPTGEGYSQHNK